MVVGSGSLAPYVLVADITGALLFTLSYHLFSHKVCPEMPWPRADITGAVPCVTLQQALPSALLPGAQAELLDLAPGGGVVHPQPRSQAQQQLPALKSGVLPQRQEQLQQPNQQQHPTTTPSPQPQPEPRYLHHLHGFVLQVSLLGKKNAGACMACVPGYMASVPGYQGNNNP